MTAITEEMASPHDGGEAGDPPPVDGGSGRLGPPSWLALGFLLPALLLLGALVCYPIIYTAIRSFFDASGKKMVGLDNYTAIFTDHDSLTAVRNTAIWVVVAPTVVTILGLLFAVLTERIRWSTAFKMVVFMPMAVSFLASGVIFRLVYEQDPSMGVANAVVTSVHDTFAGGSRYPGASVRDGDKSPDVAQGGAVMSRQAVQPGGTAILPLVGVKPENLPKTVTPAKAPAAAPGGISGLVWFDFTKGGGGTLNAPDASEAGLGGMKVQAVSGSKVVGSATTEDDGSFVIKKLPAGSYTLKLPKDNFAASYGGVNWLGSALITPAIIASYMWVWAGFAMVLIAAGLAAIPRDALEAARVDGATEWQVFRRVTIPLLAPVLTVVFVTLLIYALKVFDLVFIIGGGDPNASVLAVRMWTDSFGGGNDQGAGSAVAILLFLLVVPAMLFNLRKFRQEKR
ncbi:ABC transporter permease subunit [Actinomadura sp. DC4]|uniref:ABC transporter permease subunit n=1 Tax=Actinomadura sp. DC4 TaxID=3055069 RepID=UPI0025AFAA0F|nr:ABC transporter permease subunit [Actinomadura sp. DC4]MDN3360186.1 ABC transporter permease subunit [Actinomadura sp. DC4]